MLALLLFCAKKSFEYLSGTLSDDSFVAVNSRYGDLFDIFKALKMVSVFFFLNHLEAFKEFSSKLDEASKQATIKLNLGSSCGAVCRAVASNTRDLLFKSSHWQNLFAISTLLKTRKKTKVGLEWPIKKPYLPCEQCD